MDIRDPRHVPPRVRLGPQRSPLAIHSRAVTRIRSRGVSMPNPPGAKDTIMTEHTHVVVIGGGYAGVRAANRLTRRDDVTVTLINPRRTFVDRIRLHQHVGGSYDEVVDYRKVLAQGVRLLVGTVTRLDAAERSLTL